MKAWWPAAAVVALSSALYFLSLGTAPVYVGGDEARFATAASSIAASGRDNAGNRLPLFFHMSDSFAAADGGTRWYQPLLFYLMALVFRFVPLTEGSMRIPTVVIGLVDISLMYVVARRLFGDRFWAAVAALMLALSPAHFIFSRQALDYICPLPFVLGWLWCLLAALETGNVWLFVGAGFLLGVGFYSHIAAWVMMPLLLLLTWAVVFQSTNVGWRAALAATIGFAVPVAAVVPWLWTHPEMWRDTVGRYKVYDARHLSPLQGAKDFLNYNNVQERVSVYWDYFNPAFLFFSGGSNLTAATRKIGVFLLPVSLFLVCGIYDLWRRRPAAVSLMLLTGLAVAPLPATLVDERYAIQRELFVLPFGVLISVFGALYLLRDGRYAVRIVAVALLAAMPIQFAYFYRDYFTDYRIRSAFWFDPANVRGISEYLLAHDPPRQAAPAMYFSQDLDDVAARWRFYLIKNGREDLLQRTRMFDPGGLNVREVPPGSLLVFYANDPAVPTLLGADRCSVATFVMDAAGGRSAVILRKSG